MEKKLNKKELNKNVFQLIAQARSIYDDYVYEFTSSQDIDEKMEELVSEYILGDKYQQEAINLVLRGEVKIIKYDGLVAECSRFLLDGAHGLKRYAEKVSEEIISEAFPDDVILGLEFKQLPKAVQYMHRQILAKQRQKISEKIK